MFAHDLLLFAYKQREDTTYIFNQIATATTTWIRWANLNEENYGWCC